MSADERVDDLLDEWEELLAENPQADVQAFVDARGGTLDDESLKRFRKKASALANMNERLGALQDTDSLPGDTSRPIPSRHEFANLQPGYEPIEGYKLVERLGAGGFGEVWKATDAQGFSVAIKFVQLGGKFGDKELRSLDVIKDVRHPHLLTIFGTRQLDDVLVIAMELADRTLLARQEEAVKEGYDGIPRDELLEYMAEAAKGIDFLNDPGTSSRPRIQHRDIKPHNLLLSGNSVKIADYGLAQALTFNVAESTGSTPAYAAPEFFEGNTTSRSDQYSLAITYCFLRSGRVPFQGSVVELMEAHRNLEPDLSMLPPEERPAVARALSKKSKDRWPSCTAFVRQLGASDNDKKPSDGSSPHQNASSTTTVQSPRTKGMKAKIVIGNLGCALSVTLACIAITVTFPTVSLMYSPAPQKLEYNQILHYELRHRIERPRIAVLYFENQSEGEKGLDALAKGLCSMMITRLDAKREYDLVERERLQKVLDELKLTRSAMFDQKDVANIGKLVGARFLVLGTYFQILNIFRIDARLVDVETGITVAAAGVEGKSDEFSTLLSQLVDQLVQKHLGVDDSQLQKGDAEQPSDEAAAKVSLRLASELGVAVDAFDRGEVNNAVAIIDAIIESNPGFDEATRLHQRWTAAENESESERKNGP